MKIEVEEKFTIKLEISHREACLFGTGLGLIMEDEEFPKDVRELADKIYNSLEEACDINGITAEQNDIHKSPYKFISLDSEKTNAR